MLPQELILEALDDLGNNDFKIFKWYLSSNVLDGCRPIPVHRLENADRTDIVSNLMQRYGDTTAVTITMKVLRKMNQNATAQALEKAYGESKGGPAASSTTSSSAAAAAPSAVSADNGSVVFCPNVSNATGTWNITINRS